ncbi:hypothetical protein [Roseimicrobium sp. ORNL1]|uniref:hypothetical protein n=1 Tax=Roseimicrobium sp. ORNL1 TaxID=2711231 RepID=UPI0013E19080|nr:hypothetical protein [Roseimicrobium sp. ORNL1]QIF04862.1 hypothetical protein G5S37_26210 [Roseimicrobium sp. ORNL1]
MFPAVHRRILALALLGCIAAGSAPAATVLSPRMDTASGIDIRLESWLDACPPAGFVPIRIRIRNVEKQTHTWTITSQSNNGGSSSVDITVEGGKEGERMMYAPILLQAEATYYTNVGFRVSGPGVAEEAAGNVQNGGGYASSRTEYIGMSASLHAKGWSALEGKFSSSSHSSANLQGSKVDMSSAPEDWRGYAGLAQLWMDESEWTSMSGSAKAAMLEWVALGGDVHLLCADTSDARLEQLGLPPLLKSGRRVGAGEIHAHSWDGNSLPLVAMVSEIRGVKDTTRRELMSDYRGKWGLAEIVGPLTIKSGLIFGFIAIFGLLVGPVNLFLLAGTGKRQRLFWTTPLLSLGASALLLALMVLQDGIGGSGARSVFALMLPDQKRVAVTQEQVVKTGVLLGRSFERADADLMAPLNLTSASQPSNWESRYNVEESETKRGGAWFASRSLQAHLLQTVRPSRAGVEVFAAEGGGAPSVLSTVEATLQRVFIVDQNSKVWTAEDVGTGEKKVMKASTEAELNQWMNDHAGKTSGPMIAHLLKQVERRPGFAYAEAAEASKFAVATLPSIRWNHERLLLAGPYVKH